jgi:hypothetical protein
VDKEYGFVPLKFLYCGAPEINWAHGVEIQTMETTEEKLAEMGAHFCLYYFN